MIVLRILYVVTAGIISAAMLYVLIPGWISYIFGIQVLGSDFHQFFGVASNQLSTFQISWILGQTLFFILILISAFLIHLKWWFYYIWSILIIEFILTNLDKSNLTDLFFWIPLVYTVVLFALDRKILKNNSQNSNI